MSIPFDDSQRQFIESNAENIRLLAPAGSGKTLSLLERCRWLAENKKNIDKPRFLIVTFTRAARDELKTRLFKDYVSIQSLVEIITLNKWGFDYIKGIKSQIVLGITKPDIHFLFTNDLQPVWSKYPLIANNPNKLTGISAQIMRISDEMKNLGFRHDSRSMKEHINHQIIWLKENGLESYFYEKVYKDLINLQLIDVRSQNITERLVPFWNFWVDACNFLWGIGKISFDDQKYWTLLMLEESNKNGLTRNGGRYHHIMVDEFQDINPLDLSLIRTLVNLNRSTLTIVGDDDQAIFEWRGSTPHFILYPEKHFGKNFQTYKLASNYRSPTNIVRFSQNLIFYNKKRELKNVVAKTKSSDARVDNPIFPSHNDSLNLVIELARSAYQSGQPKKLAIVGRKKSQLLPIQILLTSKNIPYYAKEDLDVLNSDAFGALKSILAAIAQKSNIRSQTEIVNDLRCCCDYVGTYKLNKAKREHLENFLLLKRPHTLLDGLKYLEIYRPIDSENKYLAPVMRIFESKTVFEAIEAIGELRGMEKHYGKADDDIFFKDPPFAYLAEFSQIYGNRFWDFIHQIEDFASINRLVNTDDGSIDKDLIKQPIHVMTATRTKGKEFDTVVLLDVNDGVWPNQLASSSDELEQERRIFYVAITRPKQALVLLTVKSIAGKPVKTSPYIAEMGLMALGQNFSEQRKHVIDFQTSVIENLHPELPSRFSQPAPANNKPIQTEPIPNLKASPVPSMLEIERLNDFGKKIFFDVYQQCNQLKDGWVEWENFRNILKKLYPSFHINNSKDLKFKTVITAYSDLLDYKRDDKHYHIVYVRLKGQTNLTTEKQPIIGLSKIKKVPPEKVKDDLKQALVKSISQGGGWVNSRDLYNTLDRHYPEMRWQISELGFKSLYDFLRGNSDMIEISPINDAIRLKKIKS